MRSRGKATLRVGLTGGLAAGKSTAAALLAEAGCTVFDADRLVEELYRPGQPGAEAVREAFGERMLAGDGSVDRAALAAEVFRDPVARRRLEALIHPLVRERFRRLAAATPGIVVLEAALLAEARWRDTFDVLVTVEASTATRLERAVARGMQREEALRRLAAQTGEEQRREEADFVLDNAGDPAELRRQVEALVARFRTLQRRP